MAISYGVPENREFHFKRAHLGFELKTYSVEKKHQNNGNSSTHYVYICKKLPGADKKSD